MYYVSRELKFIISTDGNTCLYSISDNENILNVLKEEQSSLTAGTTIRHRMKTISFCNYTLFFFKPKSFLQKR